MGNEVSSLVTIRVALEEDMQAIRKCRYDVYSKEGFIDPSDFPDGQEFDQFDESSVHVIAQVGDSHEAAGTTRIILGKYSNLPVQYEPHLVSVPKIEKAGEISRLCVRDSHRDGKISIGLYRVLFHVIEQRGVEVIYVIVDNEFFETLCWLGFPFEKIGEPKDYMGYTIPAKCVIGEVLPSLQSNETAKKLGVTALFEQQFNGKIVI